MIVEPSQTILNLASQEGWTPRVVLITPECDEWIMRLNVDPDKPPHPKKYSGLKPRELANGFLERLAGGAKDAYNLKAQEGGSGPFLRIRESRKWKLAVYEARLSHIRLFCLIPQPGIFLFVLGQWNCLLHASNPKPAEHTHEECAKKVKDFALQHLSPLGLQFPGYKNDELL
ncbi:hypothetical protein E3E11_06730 [Oecophyllibacter saccharovorans]|uniref:hypothetical protein n=1 Tax=Oecophyllibacter saccharovorans TaxID=2558360 RepID=UPI001144C99B|nr:hypothetical protein [Oecophyllibacter saccharovorans]QDH15600.1 hypothetical protein E3E11_06730 [Oecophyllibacter saccharovorans]